MFNRGKIFEAVVPFVGERHLEFFIPDKNCSYTGKTRRGIVVAFDSEFLRGEKVLDVVLGLKARKVVNITNDKLNHDVNHDDISIAKIYGIKEEDKAEEWYQDSIYGVHKNMLLQEKQDISVFLPLIISKILSHSNNEWLFYLPI